MATFVAIRNVKQTRGALAGAMGYVAKDEKTLWRGISLVAGHNCVPQSSYIEFLTTKKRFHKTEGRQFYHFVQSFAEGDRLSPQMANAIGVELAEQEFPDFEVLVATHIDTGHLHNHLIVNSVSCVDSKATTKLTQTTGDAKVVIKTQKYVYANGFAKAMFGILGDNNETKHRSYDFQVNPTWAVINTHQAAQLTKQLKQPAAQAQMKTVIASQVKQRMAQALQQNPHLTPAQQGALQLQFTNEAKAQAIQQLVK